MSSGVGTILREARNRREIQLTDVEAATRIRLRYLRAIENEEWDVLPGGVYTRGFIRTYASHLGLDGERLVEDYRESVERWHRGPVEPVRSVAQPGPGGALPRRLGIPLAGLAVLGVIAIAVVAVVAIPGGDGDRTAPAPSAGRDRKADADRAPRPSPVKSGVSVRLAARAEVWVCVLDARGQPLVDGQILQPGSEEGPFRSGSFTVSFGNGEVTMLIDGREAEIATTASPIGYAIDSSGSLTELAEAERPTCA